MLYVYKGENLMITNYGIHAGRHFAPLGDFPSIN